MPGIDAQLLCFLHRRKIRLGLRSSSAGGLRGQSISPQLARARAEATLQSRFACFGCEVVLSWGKRFESCDFGVLDLCTKCANRALEQSGFYTDAMTKSLPGGMSRTRMPRQA